MSWNAYPPNFLKCYGSPYKPSIKAPKHTLIKARYIRKITYKLQATTWYNQFQKTPKSDKSSIKNKTCLKCQSRANWNISCIFSIDVQIKF